MTSPIMGLEQHLGEPLIALLGKAIKLLLQVIIFIGLQEKFRNYLVYTMRMEQLLQTHFSILASSEAG